MKILGRFLFTCLAFSWAMGVAAAESAEIKAELVSEVKTVIPGRSFTVGVRLEHLPGWHTYWINPGDSGKATTVKWEVPTGITIGDLSWPTPERFMFSEFVSFGYGADVILLAEANADPSLSGESVTVATEVQWIACKEICIPGRADLQFKLPVVSSISKVSYDERLRRQFDRFRRSSPQSLSSPGAPRGIKAEYNDQGLQIEGEWVRANFSAAGRAVDFFPLDGVWVQARSRAKPVVWQKNRFTLQFGSADLMPGATGTLRGILIFEGGTPGKTAAYEVALPIAGNVPSIPAVAQAEPSSSTMPTRPSWVWFWAFLGGVILNAMPCVFPVLALKILSYLRSMREDGARPWGMVSWFSLGVLISFWCITLAIWGLRVAGERVGWGFQLQSPVFVSLLAFLFFLMSLNLLGMFEVGLGLGRVTQRFGTNHHPGVESFISGMVAVLVAAPCTGPYMGSAIGFAIAQDSLVMALSVFTALAAGMVTPYWVALFFPRVMEKILPKPGLWMVRLKEFLAFPLLLTAVWLLWVLGQQGGANAVAGSLLAFTVAGLSIWLARASFKGDVFFAGVLFLLAVGIVIVTAVNSVPNATSTKVSTAMGDLTWIPFDEKTFAEERKKPGILFVDFTAAWCLTCQVNERVVFSNSRVLEKLREKKVRLMRADWTQRDPAVTRALETLGRTGVPVGVFYAGEGTPPQILPNLWTPATFIEFVEAAAQSASR